MGIPSGLGKYFDHDVLELNHAFGVVRLDGKGAFTQLAARTIQAIRLRVINGLFAIDLDDDALAVDFDVVIKPLVVFYGRGIHHVLNRVQATRFSWGLCACCLPGIRSLFRANPFPDTSCGNTGRSLIPVKRIPWLCIRSS